MHPCRGLARHRWLAGVLLASGLILDAACGPPETPLDPGRTPVWLDIAPTIGEPGRDVDDAFALIQALGSDQLAVRGVSAVFGDVPLVRTWPITQDLVERFAPGERRAWRGAAGPHERQAPTEASEALATALRTERLTIVALGPLTNVASALSRDQALAARVVRIVAVAGRWAGATGETGVEGPESAPAVALDVEAMRQVLESSVPLTLVPAAPASPPMLTDADIAYLAEGPVAARFLAEHARGWLRLSQERGADGFHTVDTMAVDLVAAPNHITCIEASAQLDDDGLRVGHGVSDRAVTWCAEPDAAFTARLVATLTGR